MAETPGLVRQWKILQILSVRRLGVTVQELADDAGVNLRTIRRDLKLFQQLGLPLEEQSGENGKKFWRIAEEGRLPALQLTVEEAAALFIGQRLLEPLAGTVFWKASRAAFDKIRSRLGAAALRHLEKLADGFHQTASGKSDYSEKAQLIDELVMAIEDRRLTVLTYHSLRSTEPVTYYDVHPYALVFHKGALYLVAWSCDHEEIRTFKVDRLSDVDVQGLQFERPRDFQIQKHLAGAFGLIRRDGPPTTVKVRFRSTVVRILEEKQFHESQTVSRRRDGSADVEFRLTAFEEFLSWILSFGPHAEILEPTDLRQRLTQMLQAALEVYEQPIPPVSTLESGSRPRTRSGK